MTVRFLSDAIQEARLGLESKNWDRFVALCETHMSDPDQAAKIVPVVRAVSRYFAEQDSLGNFVRLFNAVSVHSDCVKALEPVAIKYGQKLVANNHFWDVPLLYRTVSYHCPEAKNFLRPFVTPSGRLDPQFHHRLQ